MMPMLHRLGLLALALVGSAAVAWAHTGGSTGYASITVSGSTIRYTVTLQAVTLPPDLADALRRAREGSERSRETLLDVLRTRIGLIADGIRCEPGPGRVVVSAVDAPTFTMLLDFACATVARELVVQDDIFDVLGPDHHTLAKVEGPSGIQQFAFDPDNRVARFPILDHHVSVRPTGSFFFLGIHHIMTGYDHLLFLLALLLRGGDLPALMKIITAFTIAHSVTLSLAVFEVITLSDRLIEAVIALSIAFVAAENLFGGPTVSRRWLVSFAFGLVHGFGFSSALRELSLPAHGLLLSLFGFNVGVEVGQAVVVAASLPLLLLLRRTRWGGRAVLSSSLAILVAGLVLFIERVVL